MVIVKYRTEKEKKFAEFSEVFAEDIYKVCLYFTKDKVTAQQAAQQTFLDFYDHFESISPEMYRAYLIHMAKKMALENSQDES